MPPYKAGINDDYEAHTKCPKCGKDIYLFSCVRDYSKEDTDSIKENTVITQLINSILEPSGSTLQ